MPARRKSVRSAISQIRSSASSAYGRAQRTYGAASGDFDDSGANNIAAGYSSGPTAADNGQLQQLQKALQEALAAEPINGRLVERLAEQVVDAEFGG